MSATITKALHEVMTKVGYVQKKGKNEFHRYSYASEADLLEALRPAMLDAGLLLIPSGQTCSPIDEYGNTHVSVAYTLAHKDGDVWPDKIVAFGSGNDKNSKGGVQDKGTYKALTGANKYLLFKLFQIETGDDPENAAHEAPPPRTAAPKPPAKKPAPKKQITLMRALDGSQVHFPSTANGAVEALLKLQDMIEESMDNWAANREVAMRIMTTAPSVDIAGETIADFVTGLVQRMEGPVP